MLQLLEAAAPFKSGEAACLAICCSFLQVKREQHLGLDSDLTSAPSPSHASGLPHPQPPACSGWPQWPCTKGALYSQHANTEATIASSMPGAAQQHLMPHKWS